MEDTGEVLLGGLKLKYTKVDKMKIDPHPCLEDVPKVAAKLQAVYMEPNKDARCQAEKDLDIFCTKPHFIATLLSLMQSTNQDGINEIQRKSAAVLLDKKITYYVQIWEYLDEELQQIFEMLMKPLFSPTFNTDLHLFLRSSLLAVTSNLHMRRNDNFIWRHFVPRIWAEVSENPASIYGSMLVLESIVSGSESLPIVEKNPTQFLGNLVALGNKILEEFSKAPNRTERLIWQTAKTYFKLLHSTTRYMTKKLELNWVEILMKDEGFSTLVSRFLVSDNGLNEYGPTAIHFWISGHKETSETVNKMREYILEIAELLMSKVLLSSEHNKKKLLNTPFRGVVELLLETCCHSMCSLADQPVSFYDLCQNDLELESVCMTQVKLITSLCKKGTKFYNVYAKHHEAVFLKAVLPIARISLKEVADMKEDPAEFVNYTTDLLGFPQSGTCKAEIMKMLMAFLDSVDGAITKYFTLLLGIFKECILTTEGESLAEVRQVAVFRNFKVEEFVDVALLLLASISYAAQGREDLMEQVRGFMFGQLDKILSIDNPWLQSRLTQFISQYFTAIFSKQEDFDYLKRTMIWMTKLLLSSNQLVNRGY